MTTARWTFGRPAATDDQRPYLDHSRFIGDYQPFFPAYSFDVEDGIGRGLVTFPIAFEGPPGCAHGGFVALLFDCVFQHLNSDLGSTGKTANLQISFKRPTPILTELTIETRQAGLDGRKLTTTGELRLGDDVVAEAETLAIVRPREDMPDTP